MPSMPDWRHKLGDHMEWWAATALEQDWVEGWVEGAIFPREMAMFLAWCDLLAIREIVESGRQDGYSTMLLARYATRSGGTVRSIDLELDPARAERCRTRLADFGDIAYYRGDAFRHLGAALRDARARPTAVLIDGPKSFHGLALLMASAGYGHVRLVGLHNLDPETPERDLLARALGRPTHHEDIGGSAGAAWIALGQRERAHLERCNARRRADRSTLGVGFLGRDARRRMLLTVHRRFLLQQPALLAALWHIHADAAVHWVHRLSFKLERLRHRSQAVEVDA